MIQKLSKIRKKCSYAIITLGQIKNYNFGLYNNNIPSKGPFWTSESTEDEFSRIMYYLINVVQ